MVGRRTKLASTKSIVGNGKRLCIDTSFKCVVSVNVSV